MDIICIETGPIMTNCYIVVNEQNNSAFIIDTSLQGAASLFEEIEKRKLKVEFILLTHSHWDHAGDAKIVHEKYNVPVMIHKEDEYRILNPNENVVIPIPWQMESFQVQKYLNHNDKIEFNDKVFEIRHTPGHTEGGISIINHSERVIFAGDTIFKESIGRTDLPGGDFELLLESIKTQILTLDDDYTIFSGHGEKTTVGYEKSNNPFIINYLTNN